LEARIPIWGIGGGGAHCGGLAMVMQVGGGEPTMAGRRSGGERRLRVCGTTVSSGGARCGDGGARRWPEVALDGRAASATEGGGRLGASTVASGGRWLSGRLAWCRGTRGQCEVVGASALGAMECGESRAEWRRSVAIVGRGETVSPMDRQRNGVTHGATAACVACGADLAAG
jgi:hypothetical protein